MLAYPCTLGMAQHGVRAGSRSLGYVYFLGELGALHLHVPRHGY